MNYQTVKMNQADTVIFQQDTILIDLRTPSEYLLGHLKGAINIPMETLQDDISSLSKYRHKKLLLYCSFGNSSLLASRRLSAAGFSVTNLYGGIKSYHGKHMTEKVNDS